MMLQDAFPRAYVIANWRDYEIGGQLELTKEQAEKINLTLVFEGIPCMWCKWYEKPEEAN